MITFLRKIRKDLIDSSSTRKYLLYAIGEILLVMIGILLALRVNNYNEAKIKDGQIQAHLENLIESLDDDIDVLSTTLEINSFRYYSLQYLLEISGREIYKAENSPPPIIETEFLWEGPYPDTFNIQFIKRSFSWLGRGNAFSYINNSAIEEINNAGLFSDIENKELKKAISRYYNFVNWRFGKHDIEYIIKMSTDFSNLLRDKYELWTLELNNVDKVLELLETEESVYIRMKELIEEVSWHCNGAVRGINKAKELIKFIEVEVDSSKT